MPKAGNYVMGRCHLSIFGLTEPFAMENNPLLKRLLFLQVEPINRAVKPQKRIFKVRMKNNEIGDGYVRLYVQGKKKTNTKNPCGIEAKKTHKA